MSFFSTATGVAVVDTRTRPGTITLPLTSQIPNRYLQIKDLYGAFGRSSLTVNTQSGETFDDGTTSKVFTDPFTFFTLYAASTTRWAQLGGTQTIQQTVSSLNVSSITIGTGIGWLQLPPIQTVAVSTNTITGDNITVNSTTSYYMSAQILYVSSIMGAVVGGGGTGDVTKANLISTTANLQSAATQFVSSLTVNALTVGSGAGWLQLPPVQSIYVSTTFTQAQGLFAISSYFGGTSTATTLEYWGLFGNYNNTVLAEISTGGGFQEFLVFKGSSSSDRVRVQTTGNFVVETGVSARLWNDNTTTTLANATPAFIINSSSNVGIQTATPGATLDVAGTGRAVTFSSQQLFFSSVNGGLPLSLSNLTSTTAGITTAYQTAGFISSANLANMVSTSFLDTTLASTTAGITTAYQTAGFISSANLANMVSTPFLTTSLTSTVTGLGSIGYISSPSLTSSFISTTNFINQSFSSFSTGIGSGSSGGLTTANLTSTVTGLGSIGYISSLSLTSTVRGLASSGYISSIPAVLGTSTFTASTIATSSLQVNSLTIGTGTGWVNLGPLQTVYISSFQETTNALYAANAYIGIQSTVNSIQYNGLFGNYNNTVLAEISTGGGFQEFLVFKGSSSSDRVRVQTTGNFVIETGVSARLWSNTTIPTQSNATPAFIINTSSNVGIQTATPGATLDVAGTARAITFSSQQLFFSSVNGGLPLSAANLTSTTAGITIAYQTAGFVSSANLLNMVSTSFLNTSLASTTTGITIAYQTAGFVSSANLLNLVSTSFLDSSLTSTTAGITTAYQTAGFVSSANLLNLVSTSFLNTSLISTTNFINQSFSSFSTALGPSGLTNASLTSTVTGLGSIGYVSSLSLTSTVRGLGSIGYISTIPTTASTSAFFTSSITASTITTSSLQVNSLTIGTGTGWLNLGPIQTTIISTLQETTNAMYANTAYIGIQSTVNSIQYNGLFGNYNNTVLAEISTGGGFQELLVFKGSSASDRVRVQTTGNFVIETGVSARLWSNTTIPTQSNATPAFIINSSSNVGIQTATPGATLDVAGSVRAVTVSSQQLFFSSLNGGLPLSAANLTSTTAGITTAYQTAGFVSSPNLLNLVSTLFLNTSLASTTRVLQSNIQAWSQYPTTTDVTFASGTGILPANLITSFQIKADNLLVRDENGGYGNFTMGNILTMNTSTTSESYSFGFGPTATGSINSFAFTQYNGATTTTAPLYISSLYLGNLGGTTAGQLTTDATATDLFWKGSKLNSQGGSSGGGGGAIDYISAFTVSTGALQVSSISTYYIETYGVIGSAFFNTGPDEMLITTVNSGTINAYSNFTIYPSYDLTLNAPQSTIATTGAFYLNSSNDVRAIAPSNIFFDTPLVQTSNIFNTDTISTYSLAVFGPQTLTVNGVANLTQVNLSSINGQAFSGNYVCVGKLTANETIPATTDTVLPFAVDIDPNGWLVNPASNTTRFQPTLNGYYNITFQALWARSFGGGGDIIAIRKNGTSQIATAQSEVASNADNSLTTTKIVNLNGSTDYVDFVTYTDVTPSQDVVYGGADSPGTFFSAFYIH